MSVDFAKAFDTVTHEHILEALKRRELDEHVLGFIRESYVDCATRVKVGGELTHLIDMEVGVKQGDPMSPLLFNVALDPLFQTLERRGEGFAWGDQSVTTLAFADDLVMVSSSWVGMSKNIAILESFCSMTGMRVEPRKCFGFLLSKGEGSIVVNDCSPWMVCGEALRLTGPEMMEKYLGMGLGPGMVQGLLGPMERMAAWVRDIGRAALKPSQKVEILKTYAVPRLLYQLDHGLANVALLERVDRLIRKAVKEWLHLHPCTTDGLLYSRARDGGLGVMKLARLIPCVQARRVLRLSRSEDPLTRLATLEVFPQERFERLWLSAGGKRAETPALVELPGGAGTRPVVPGAAATRRWPVPSDWQRESFLAWCGLKSQGIGTLNFGSDKTSNCWIGRPTQMGLTEGQYIAALQVRANVFPTSEALARGRGLPPQPCRRCQGETETCSHILGQCPAVQSSRISRHNKVCALWTDEATRVGWDVKKEMRVLSKDGELRIPDLIFVKGETALVADVTVRFEFAPDTLEIARSQKVAYYRPYASEIVQKLDGVTRLFFVGLPVGARGKWPRCNDSVLRRLGVSKAGAARFAKLVVRRTLAFSLDILWDFYVPINDDPPRSDANELFPVGW